MIKIWFLPLRAYSVKGRHTPRTPRCSTRQIVLSAIKVLTTDEKLVCGANLT